MRNRNSLRVLQILPELHDGGVERGTLEVARALVRAGQRSIVVSGGGRLVPELTRQGSDHIRRSVGEKSPLCLRHVRELRRLFREVDIVHARSRVPAWLSLLALRSLSSRQRPRFVTTVHGFYSVNAWSRIMTRGDRVICVSRAVRDYVLANYSGIDSGQLDIVHRGVDPKLYPRGLRADPDWEQAFRDEHRIGERPIVLLPGRLTRLKGHFDLLELMKTLADRNVIALIAGGADRKRKTYAADLEAAVSTMPNVRLIGHRTDLREVMCISRLVLSLSTQPESFGRTVLEALSLGVPVAGYDHGGVGEVLADLFPSGRVPVGDAAGLLRCVESLLVNHPEIRPNAAYTLDAMNRGVLRVYESVSADRLVRRAA